jgi:hypothetical protein
LALAVWLLAACGATMPGCVEHRRNPENNPPTEIATTPASGPPETEPRLLSPESVDAIQIRAELDRAVEQLRELEQRPLEGGAAETRAAAADFLRQADAALAAGDLTRTSVLVQKARVLLADLLQDRG